MKISSLQELVDWLLSLDPNGQICWPCMLPHYQYYLAENDSPEALAVQKIQALSDPKDVEEPMKTFLRLLNQFILVDLSIDKNRFKKGSPLTLKRDGLDFSWKAFTHWIIAQLETVTNSEVVLEENWRSAVDRSKIPF